MKYLYCNPNILIELKKTQDVFWKCCDKIDNKIDILEEEVAKEIKKKETRKCIVEIFFLVLTIISGCTSLVTIRMGLNFMYSFLIFFIPAVIAYFTFHSRRSNYETPRKKLLEENIATLSDALKNIDDLSENFLEGEYANLCRFSGFLRAHRQDEIAMNVKRHNKNTTIVATANQKERQSKDGLVKFTKDPESFDIEISNETFRKVFPDEDTCDLSWLDGETNKLKDNIKKQICEKFDFKSQNQELLLEMKKII